MVETQKAEKVAVRDFPDVVRARRRALDMALELGFPMPEATKIAVVVSELGRNIILYAKVGAVSLLVVPEPRPHFKLVAEDNGPGIADVALALTEGYSTSSGLGLGLSGSKRIMDEFQIETTEGQGTVITAIKYL